MDHIDTLKSLIPLLSLNRSKDLAYFYLTGLTIKNITKENTIGLELWRQCSVKEMHPLCNEGWNKLRDNIVDLRVRDIVDITSSKTIKEQLRSCEWLIGTEIEETDDLLDRRIVDMSTIPYGSSCDIIMLARWAKADNLRKYNKLLIKGRVPYIIGSYIKNAIYTHTPLYLDYAGVNNTIILNEKELYPEMIPLEADVYICSAMGTGKTSSTYFLLEQSMSFLVIGGRRIQDNKYHIDIPDSTLYASKEGWETAEKLIVQLESLHKVRRFDYEYLYIDETESILRLFISSTLEGKELKTLNVFIKLLESCKHLVVMDAFLKKETVLKFIEKRASRNYRVLINTYKIVDSLSAPVTVLQYSKREQWIGTILGDARKKAIPCLNKRVAKEIADMLTKLGQSTLLITSDTPDHIKNIDPNNEYNGWIKYHNIVYTPALANSISFIKKHFDIRYMYASRNSASHEDLIQMSGRARDITDHTIHLYMDNRYIPCKGVDVTDDEEIDLESLGGCREFMPMCRETMKEWMESGADLFHNDTGKPLFADIWNVLDPWIRDTYIRAYTDRALGQRYFGDLLFFLMEKVMGWKIQKNYTCDSRGKLNPLDKEDINKSDYNRYISYINPDYKDVNITYFNIWKAGGQHSIINLATIRRGYVQVDNERDFNKAISLKGDIAGMFGIGGIDFEEAIRDRKKVILKYNSKDRDKLSTVMTKICYWYPNTKPEYKFWEWMGKFLHTKLLLPGKKLRTERGNKSDIYGYELDLTDWLYYYVNIT